MNLGMELRQRQQLTLTPKLQQALRLLQLSSLEFNQEVEAALSTNPFLEEAEPPTTEAQAAVPVAEAAGTPEPTIADAPVGEAPAAQEETAAEESMDWSDSGVGRASDSDDGDWTDWSEAPVSLHEHLRNQLLLWPLSDRERTLAHLLIDELSDAGYLETPLEDLLELMPPESGVALHELESALATVQQLEPTGIGARSLRECLLLQLAELPEDTPGLVLAQLLLERHFDLLAKRQFPRLMQLMSCDETGLHTARAVIRTLDPRPGRGYADNDVRYIVPDIIVSQVGKRWVAKINPAVQPSIRLNRSYADLAGGRGGSPCSGMLQEARWLLRNIAQRFDTIQKVADAIVSRQRVFFSYGDAAMRPMSLKDIASEVGLHESTVCRVSNGKYMATPRGLFEFKYFFSRQLETEDGGSCSALAIRALIREFIAAENPEKPLSDVQLAKLLGEQGFKLVRRTVTKYRSQMRVPSVELRRVSRH